MTRKTPVDEVRAEIVQLWGRLGPFWGIPPTAARVYAYLLSSAAPVAAEVLATELRMSRGAVSMACRELSDWGLVHAERPPGERRLSYRIEEDPARVIRGIVETRKRREWDPILDNVADWKGSLAKERSAEASVLRARLDEIERLVATVDSMAESFLGGKVLPRLGLKAIVKMASARGRRRG